MTADFTPIASGVTTPAPDVVTGAETDIILSVSSPLPGLTAGNPVVFDARQDTQFDPMATATQVPETWPYDPNDLQLGINSLFQIRGWVDVGATANGGTTYTFSLRNFSIAGGNYAAGTTVASTPAAAPGAVGTNTITPVRSAIFKAATAFTTPNALQNFALYIVTAGAAVAAGINARAQLVTIR
jgi:hypothetical protein